MILEITMLWREMCSFKGQNIINLRHCLKGMEDSEPTNPVYRFQKPYPTRWCKIQSYDVEIGDVGYEK